MPSNAWCVVVVALRIRGLETEGCLPNFHLLFGGGCVALVKIEGAGVLGAVWAEIRAGGLRFRMLTTVEGGCLL